MGKYMKKSKIAGDMAVMEVSPQSSIGVRTRARTLALQRLQKSPSSLSVAPNPDASSFSYLQLRSRRLEKPSGLVDTKKHQFSERPKKCFGESPKPNTCGVNSRMGVGSVKSVSVGSVSLSNDKQEVCFSEIAKGIGTEARNDVGFEASFGENTLEFEGKDRSTRESTPCSLIRNSDAIGTPGSTTRPKMCTMTNRINGDMERSIPTAQELDEFFAYAEQQQQRIFMEKYNFDIVNGVPLPGHYEWVQVLH
ncbi:Cyclin-dependent kinase inhibitor [Quillaja saponaria]|uniref:Cyclin-dependent kinase inhibitor n=1 Tax=Quillaja saponaria TaxID=32244 RepID=A0AAD7PMZ8_QUISA|nr:Cyclin-dependent kinase inhibitor [Quillaja saponaria]